jgi:predicted  nucleic acid-binding Zn-ribbon protein
MFHESRAISTQGQPATPLLHSISVRDQPVMIGHGIHSAAPGTLEKLSEYATESIQNKKEIDRLTHDIHITGLKIKSLTEEAGDPEKDQAKLEAMEPTLSANIDSIRHEEDTAKTQMDEIAQEIQRIKARQTQRTKTAGAAEKALGRHLIAFDETAREKKNLQTRKAALAEKKTAGDHSITAIRGTVVELGKKINTVEASLQKTIEDKAGELYRDTMAASHLLRLGNPTLLPNKKMDELLRVLHDMTNQTDLKPEQKVHFDRRLKNQEFYRKVTYRTVKAAALVAQLAMLWPILNGAYQEDKAARGKCMSPDEFTRISERMKSAESSFKNHLLVLIAITAVMEFSAFIVKSFQNSSINAEKAQLAQDNLRQRTIRPDIIAATPSPEEELFKFAFNMANHADGKFLKAPLQHITGEVNRLVTLVRKDPSISIENAVAGPDVMKKFLDHFKGSLTTEALRISAEAEKELQRLVESECKAGRPVNKNALNNMTRMNVFLARFNGTDAALKLTELSKNGSFLSLLSELFNGDNDDALIAATTNMIIDLTKKVTSEFSEVGNDEEPSALETSLREAEAQKNVLETDLEPAQRTLKKMQYKTSRLAANLQKTNVTLNEKNTDLQDLSREMHELPLTGSQLAILKPDLDSRGIELSPVSGFGELSDARIARISAEEASLPDLQKKYDALFAHYDVLQKRRNQNEDQLESLKFKLASHQTKEQSIQEYARNITESQARIAKLADADLALCNALENNDLLKEIMTPAAMKGVRRKHLAQSEAAMRAHAYKNGYASNYHSVGHMILASVDTYRAFQRYIAGKSPAAIDLNDFFGRSAMEIADGMNRNYQHAPINFSVANFKVVLVKNGSKVQKKYLIDHIYGYVPRRKINAADHEGT